MLNLVHVHVLTCTDLYNGHDNTLLTIHTEVNPQILWGKNVGDCLHHLVTPI